MSFALKIKEIFTTFSKEAFALLEKHEQLNLNLTGEETLFVRFNAGKVRQTSETRQCKLTATLLANSKKQNFSFQLTTDLAANKTQFAMALQKMRNDLNQTPQDPFAVALANNGQSDHHYAGELPDITQLLKDIEFYTKGSDFVGLYAGGENLRANANSLGQLHWFSNQTFFMDYSLFAGDRAAKSLYAGARWDSQEFKKDVTQTKVHLELLQKEKIKIKPGKYKVYLAPGAIGEIMNLLSWGGVGTNAMQTGRCGLKKFAQGEAQLSPLFSLRENFNLGFCPQFNELGEVSSPTVDIAAQGKFVQLLTSSRSAKEFFTTSNAANEGEMLRSPEILPGHLAESEVLQKLDQGLYLSNLHYLNWSDLQSGRFTGMTRYACFWVEKGQIVGPIEDMRFDESFYHIFGSGLLELSQEAKVEPEVGTYYHRAVGGKKTPGALIADFTFTL